jgi:succinate dehydrogenase cytochrome b556 subunit
MSETKPATSRTAGSWAWILQRVTAVLLVVLLGIHLLLTHFLNVNEEIDVESVSARLADTVILVVDYTMLVTVLFHGLNGLRTVLFDIDMFARKHKMIDVALLVVGIATTIWGIVILFPFLNGG